MNIYFLEISVYRLSKESYFLEMDQYLKKSGTPRKELTVQDILREAKGELSTIEQFDKDMMNMNIRSFGGGWRYNEIIGYLRFYQDGSKIKVEYWQHKAQRVRRTRKKYFIRKSHKISEKRIKDKNDSKEINEAIYHCLKASTKALSSKFYFDIENFNFMSSHIDWTYIFNIKHNKVMIDL